MDSILPVWAIYTAKYGHALLFSAPLCGLFDMYNDAIGVLVGAPPAFALELSGAIDAGIPAELPFVMCCGIKSFPFESRRLELVGWVGCVGGGYCAGGVAAISALIYVLIGVRGITGNASKIRVGRIIIGNSRKVSLCRKKEK